MIARTLVTAVVSALLFLFCAAASAGPGSNGPLDYSLPFGVVPSATTNTFALLKGLQVVSAADPTSITQVVPAEETVQAHMVYSGIARAGTVAGLRPLATIFVRGGTLFRLDLRTPGAVPVQLSSDTHILDCANPRLIMVSVADRTALTSYVLYQQASPSNPTLCGGVKMVPLNADASVAPAATALRPGFVPLYTPSATLLGFFFPFCTTVSQCSLSFIGPTATGTPVTVAPGVKDFRVMTTNEAGDSAVLIGGALRRISAGGELAPAPLRAAPKDGFTIAGADDFGRPVATTDGTTLFFTENNPNAARFTARLLSVPIDGSTPAKLMVREKSQIALVGTTPTRVVYQLGFFVFKNAPPYVLQTIDKTSEQSVPPPQRLAAIDTQQGFIQAPRILGSNVYFTVRSGKDSARKDQAFIRADDGTLVKRFAAGTGWMFGGIINHPKPLANLRATLQTTSYLTLSSVVETAPYDFQVMIHGGADHLAIGGTLALHRVSDRRNFDLTVLPPTAKTSNPSTFGNYVLVLFADGETTTPLDAAGVGTSSHTFDQLTQTPDVNEGLVF